MEKINTFCFPVLNNITRRVEGSGGLVEAIESLYKYTPHNFYVYVCFNGNDEDFNRARELLGDKVHLWLKSHRNLGFGKAMNQMIKLATTKYITLANDDVEVIYPTWWEEVEKLFQDDPDLMGFNPHSFINKKHTGDRVAQYEIKDEYTEGDIAKMKEIFKGERWYIGCCTFFTVCRKELFDQVGLFDESFGQGSGEDYDLMVRAGRGGRQYKIAGGSCVMVKHWWGATKDNLPQDPSFTSNFDLISKGNERMTEKWGKHIDKDPDGWSVSGQGGPDEPLDQDKRKYAGKGKWYVIEDL